MKKDLESVLILCAAVGLVHAVRACMGKPPMDPGSLALGIAIAAWVTARREGGDA